MHVNMGYGCTWEICAMEFASPENRDTETGWLGSWLSLVRRPGYPAYSSTGGTAGPREELPCGLLHVGLWFMRRREV